MEITRANEVIINILQNALTGELKPESNIKPQNIAEAIAQKIIFEKSYNGNKYDNIIGSFVDNIINLKEEAESKLLEINEGKNISNPEENPVLLKNFILGKITAYDEILSLFK